MTAPLVERVTARFAELVPAGSTAVVAVSGGPDSVALLDLLWLGAAAHRVTLVVGHVDHGIHPDSAIVAAAVARLATERQLRHDVRTLGLGAGTSETRARTARRRALRAIAAAHGAGAVVLAHHAHDQQETVLLRALRGSGPAGLAGMAPRRGPWVRPALEIAPDELAAHLRARDMVAWQDPANRDPRHLRSWLRTEVLPALERRLPQVRAGLLRLAAAAGADRQAWNGIPELLPGLEFRHDHRGISVAVEGLSGYRSGVQRGVLSALGRRMGVPLGAGRLTALARMLAGARSGARVRLGRGLEAELAFGRLLLHRPRQAWEAMPLPDHGLVTAGEQRFRVAVSRGALLGRAGWRTQVAVGEYRLRPWRPGDRIRPLGGPGTRSVAELFKEHRIARGEREGWPVLTAMDDDATIVWVPGICRGEAALPPIGEEARDVEADGERNAPPHRGS